MEKKALVKGAALDKHVVDGLNPFLKVSEGIFENNNSTMVGKDILLNFGGKKHDVDESSFIFKARNKVVPLKVSTDMSSAKSTPQKLFSNNLRESDTDVDSPCLKGTTTLSLIPSKVNRK